MDFRGRMATLADSVKKGDPMFWVRDMRATVAWYESIGFSILDRFEDGGDLVFAKVGFGNCEFGLSPGGESGPRDVRLWFYTDRVDELYDLLKRHRGEPEVAFDEELYEPFYGGRQFSIRDINGLVLIFWQPEWLTPNQMTKKPA
jgi:catechol 2,3-dioxygenase-like lactoylglutathione lyase family enzyme